MALMPFLFFGSRSVRTRLGEGEFDCPRCRARRRYQLLRAQQHAHLYWVPLLKLGQPQEYVECQSCRVAFEPGVLRGVDTPDADLRGAIATALTSAIAALLRADEPSQAELALSGDALHAIEGFPSPPEEVQRRLRSARRDVDGAARGLAHIEPTLNGEAREGIMRALLHLASAEAPLSAAQGDAIRAFAAALGVSSAHLKGIMLEVAERRSAVGEG